jgi:hypothetical protein
LANEQKRLILPSGEVDPESFQILSEAELTVARSHFGRDLARDLNLPDPLDVGEFWKWVERFSTMSCGLGMTPEQYRALTLPEFRILVDWRLGRWGCRSGEEPARPVRNSSRAQTMDQPGRRRAAVDQLQSVLEVETRRDLAGRLGITDSAIRAAVRGDKSHGGPAAAEKLRDECKKRKIDW